MFHRQNSQGYIGTENPPYRGLVRSCVAHSQRRWWKSSSRVSVFLVALAFFAVLSLLACFHDSSEKKTLTLATTSEPLTLNLALAKDAGSVDVLGYLFEGLTETSWMTDQVEPSLAESWTHSEDGLTWTFSLREDVTWHDGTPFTARDVDFTFNRIIYNDEIGATAGAAFNFRFLDESTGTWTEARMTVTALDDYTVQCVLPVPFAPFLRSMGTPIYPRHILERYVDSGTFNEVWDVELTRPRSLVPAPLPSSATTRVTAWSCAATRTIG